MKKQKHAQTAIEYLLLLTICAIIVFIGFSTFFNTGGRVRNATTIYFNEVQGTILGQAPSLPDPNLPGGGTGGGGTGNPCAGIICTSYNVNSCPVQDGCCWVKEVYSWYQPSNDPSVGAGQCMQQGSGDCIYAGSTGSCDVFVPPGYCCVQDQACQSMGGGC